MRYPEPGDIARDMGNIQFRFGRRNQNATHIHMETGDQAYFDYDKGLWKVLQPHFSVGFALAWVDAEDQDPDHYRKL